MNIGRRKRCTTRNIVSGKLNVKCVSVRLGNVIGQDMWELESICWGAVVEKLMVLWGEVEDETQGRAKLTTTTSEKKTVIMNFTWVWAEMVKKPLYDVVLVNQNATTYEIEQAFKRFSHFTAQSLPGAEVGARDPGGTRSVKAVKRP